VQSGSRVSAGLMICQSPVIYRLCRVASLRVARSDLAIYTVKQPNTAPGRPGGGAFAARKKNVAKDRLSRSIAGSFRFRRARQPHTYAASVLRDELDTGSFEGQTNSTNRRTL